MDAKRYNRKQNDEPPKQQPVVIVTHGIDPPNKSDQALRAWFRTVLEMADEVDRRREGATNAPQD